MHGKIKNYLNLSLPRLLTFRWGWLYLLAVSVLNIVSVYWLHPFGEPDPLVPHQPFLLTGFAWTCVGTYILLYQLVPLVINRIFNVEVWTLLREIRTFSIYFVVMVFINWGYASAVIPSHETGWPYFICILCFTLLYQILLVAFVTLFNLMIYFIKLATEIKVPEVPVAEAAPESMLDLTMFHAGKYPLNEIRFFKVIGNYCYMHNISAGKPVEKDLKISLTKMEEILKPYPQFVKCHYEYIVNTDKIAKYTGSKRKMKLHLMNHHAEVPVSYKHSDKMIQLIKKKQQRVEKPVNFPRFLSLTKKADLKNDLTIPTVTFFFTFQKTTFIFRNFFGGERNCRQIYRCSHKKN